MSGRPSGAEAGRWAGAALALVVLHLALALPPDPQAFRPVVLLRPALELALLVAAIAFCPGAWRRPLRLGLWTLLALLVVLKVADAGFYTAFDRPFDPVVDGYLLPAGWTLLSGTVGWLRAAAAVLAALGACVALVAAIGWSLRVLEFPRGARHGRSAAAVVATGLVVLSVSGPGPRTHRPPLPAQGALFLTDHVRTSARSVEDATVFRAALASDPYGNIADSAILSGLKGKDVVLVFVESYGRDAIEDDRYAPVVQARLAAADREIARSGFEARSAWLDSATFGGQSWLAHETLLSGLWIDGGRRYDQLIGSHRATLIRDFRRAGWRTVAVMPAISEAWPEGGFFGYDRIYAARDLGYRGPPFNWITMPDQFTLAAFRRAELERNGRPPVMAEIALISSHAPFVPIPPLLAWDKIGDGKVYEPVVKGSAPPQVVWRDMKVVGQKYAASIDYSLASLAAYVRDYGDDRLVMIVLGDHQPGNVITRAGASHQVPIHILAKDPKVLRTVSGWGWTAGMRPGPKAPAWRMDQFRGRLVEGFTPSGR